MIAAVLAAVADDRRELIYRDDAMARVVKLAQQVAPSDASVLITGESGTGKEVLARYVHARSNRAKKPFICVNCAAIPETLLESELFGHEKGAFTGAVARRIGKFEEANGGTLLLDEISEMDVRLQAKLLRAIQERVIDRVGGTRPVPIDIRIIATSNRNLAEAVREGTFREDLLFRLNVVNLKIPPLRERPADVIELAQYFIKKYAAANGVPARPLSQEARRTLTRQLLAGQCARAGKHHASRRADGDRRGDRRRGDPRARRRPPRSAAQRAVGRPCRARRRAGLARRWSAAPSPRSSATSSWRRSSIVSATAPTPPTCSASRSARCATSSTNMPPTAPVPPPGGGEPRAESRREARAAAALGWRRGLPFGHRLAASRVSASTITVSTSPAPLRRNAAAFLYSSEVKQATPCSKVGNSITTKR